MKYILEGDEKELGRVLREQRIRIGRGLIKITPISGTLVHEDYALKAIEAQVKELTETLAAARVMIVWPFAASSDSMAPAEMVT